MIGEKELEAVKLSPVKADFYQLWSELVETADKLSERWQISTTNESDPGVVLLKVLTAVADKLNYTINANTLECFMPSAAQEESMRKLCEMLGYNMKYYQSATTEITISYNKPDTESDAVAIVLPAYTTNFKNNDDDINYFLLEDVVLDLSDTTTDPVKTVAIMEGEVVDCGEDTDGIITINQLDDNNRYYLPETQIAENGIFVKNVNDAIVSSLWEKVDNLNTQEIGKLCYKFGYDSKVDLPYIQFPEDIGTIIEDGLLIKYTRTNGINGNIRVGALSKILLPADLSETFSEDNFVVKNSSAATNGTNKESIDEAYTMYKKTIGTFDTLVTCRDYMNAIYKMTDPDNNTTPLVSNVIVSDIRDDINKAFNLCSFNEFGIYYEDRSIRYSDTDLIDHFDLILYPFTTVTGANTKEEYTKSFKYNPNNNYLITAALENKKTISHKIKDPDGADVNCIKIYLKLQAKITTSTKVNTIEEDAILKNIYKAIYKNFNSRKIDFGEEIPFDSILKTVQEADSRIKNVALEEPILATTFCTASGAEYPVPSNIEGNATSTELMACQLHNKMALRNVLAGRIPLFDYDEDFKPEYTEKEARIYPESESDQIAKIESKFTILNAPTNQTPPITLSDNEVVQFRRPSFITEKTYPAYVNYFLHLSNDWDYIAANTEYLLKPNEYLLINYTPSVTTTEGESAAASQAVNLCIENTVIKPNFNLGDSKHASDFGYTPSKKSGYDFSAYGPYDYQGDVNDADGMYTLGVNEQIEIRKRNKVVLDGDPTYIYWEKNSDKDADNNTTLYLFPVTATGYATTYTLKEGEYIYYTDAAKLDLAYYGNGTVIELAGNAPNPSKVKANEESLAEDIANNGLLAAIPWVVQHYSETQNLTITEYQYTTVVKDGQLSVLPDNISSAANGWIDLSTSEAAAIRYKYNKDDAVSETLPGLDAGSDIKWQMRTILNMNMSPTSRQVLRRTENVMDSIILNSDSDNPIPIQPTELTSTDTETLLSIKSNYPIVTANSEISGVVRASGGDITYPYKLKTFDYEDVQISNGAIVSLGNFGINGNWTKIAFKDLSDLPAGSSISLNISLPTGKKGLIMFYYIDDKNNGSSNAAHRAYLTASNDEGSVSLAIINNKNEWWTDGVDDTKYYFRDATIAGQGLNIVQIDESCTLTIYPDTDRQATLIFSNLDICNCIELESDFAINKKLGYWDINGSTVKKSSTVATVLSDIKTLDPNHEFYYNAMIDNSTAIDLNPNISAEEESLATPRVYYDYNNINNKFVISEIDANYLKTGITLTNSSRRS